MSLACALTQPAFFLEREVQAFRQAAEGQRRATERSVLLGEPGKFLAAMRTVISHKHGPLRSSRAFEFDDIHTGYNEYRHENRTLRVSDAPRRFIAGDGCLVFTVGSCYIKSSAEVDSWEFLRFSICARTRLSQKGTTPCSIMSQAEHSVRHP
jgi:hypothetical protein